MDFEQNTDAATTQAPAPGSDEYNAAMLAKKREARGEVEDPTEDATEAPADDAPQRPENVPEKFWDAERGEVNVEALLKSYTELEKGKGGEPEKTTDGAEGVSEDDVKSAVETVGLDYDALTSAIAETGDIPEDAYETFEKAGIPKKMVQTHIQLLQFHRDVQTERAYAKIEAEGETAEGLMSWAASNLPKERIERLNAQLASTEWEDAVDTLVMLKSKATKTAGEPNLETGAQSPGGAAEGYASRDEMLVDMRNPLYHARGPEGDAFRAKVARKRAASR